MKQKATNKQKKIEFTLPMNLKSLSQSFLAAAGNDMKHNFS